MSTLFHFFVLLHILCVVGGFGVLAYNGLILDLARRRSDAAAAGVINVNGEVSNLAESLVYGVLVFGIAAVVTSNHTISFSKPWVGAAMGIYVILLGIFHGMIRPARKRFSAALLELAETPSMAPPQRPPQMDELDSLGRRISLGWGIFNVLVVVALYLMVFKP